MSGECSWGHITDGGLFDYTVEGKVYRFCEDCFRELGVK